MPVFFIVDAPSMEMAEYSGSYPLLGRDLRVEIAMSCSNSKFIVRVQTAQRQSVIGVFGWRDI